MSRFGDEPPSKLLRARGRFFFRRNAEFSETLELLCLNFHMSLSGAVRWCFNLIANVVDNQNSALGEARIGPRNVPGNFRSVIGRLPFLRGG